MSEKRLRFLLGILLALCLVLPYLFAWGQGNSNAVFGGFLINAADGHSYLAKMQIGWRGDWRFTLPYTAIPGEGAFLFLFYILLGHIARIFSLPLLVVFHGARLAGALALYLALIRWTDRLYSESWQRNLGLAGLTFGSGLGWIVALRGVFSSDFWVAEAFPFLSMYTNPHFSLGLALILWTITEDQQKHPLWFVLSGLLLAIIQPFGVVITIIVLAGRWLALGSGEYKNLAGLFTSPSARQLAGFGLAGGGLLVYQYWAITTDPVLGLWNQQNITPSPPAWDIWVAFGILLVLGLFGAGEAWMDREKRPLLAWAVVGLGLAYVPWNLQRRFLTGLYVPLASLAVYGITVITSWTRLSRKAAAGILMLLIIPTNLIIILSGVQASLLQDRNVYLPAGLLDGMDWVSHNAREDALILTDAKTGLLIPSLTGRRVYYGHPFESVPAASELEYLGSIFKSHKSAEVLMSRINSRALDFLIITEEYQAELNPLLEEGGFDPVYKNSSLTIYPASPE